MRTPWDSSGLLPSSASQKVRIKPLQQPPCLGRHGMLPNCLVAETVQACFAWHSIQAVRSCFVLAAAAQKNCYANFRIEPASTRATVLWVGSHNTRVRIRNRCLFTIASFFPLLKTGCHQRQWHSNSKLYIKRRFENSARASLIF